MTGEILRTFVAIELDEPLRTAIMRVQGKFRRLAPPGSVKWVAPDGIHLTLKFLGDTPPSRLGEIEAALRAACAGVAPFEFSVEGRGCFPNTRRPRVVWVAVRDKGQMLARLQTAIEQHVAPLGWPDGRTRLLAASDVGPRCQGRQPDRGGGGRTDGREGRWWSRSARSG